MELESRANQQDVKLAKIETLLESVNKNLSTMSESMIKQVEYMRAKMRL